MYYQLVCKALRLEITEGVSTDREEVGKLNSENTLTFRDPEDDEPAKESVNEPLKMQNEYQKSVSQKASEESISKRE